MSNRNISALLVFAFASLTPSAVQGGAAVVIQNGDPAGVGFNDPTAVSPVGGNPGTTLGQQRMIAMQAAANKWGATLDSVPTVTALVTWDALSCSTDSAELGVTSPRSIWADFAGAKVPGTWYPAALANALFGGDLDSTTLEIEMRFNVNLGNGGCLAGVSFYLGLDNNHGNNVDLVTTATHELAHGLGFLTFTDGSTGAEDASDGTPRPSIFDDFLLDTTTGLLWKDMSDAQRAASAINTRRLVWNGPNVKTAVPQVLKPGTPLLKVNSPPAVAGIYSVGLAQFGPALSSPGVTAPVVQAFDTSPSPSLVCNPLTGANATAVNGKIALIDRGMCNFTVKVENAQNAGAVAVLIADNVAGSPPDPMAGTDPTIFIPSVRISQADGVTLKSALSPGPVSATLGVNLAVLQGADASNRVLMYTPNPFQGGSSVSHVDLIAFPDQLMEPAIAGDESHEVTPPKDLTAMFMVDMGWNLSIAAPPAAPVLISPANGSTVVGFSSLNWMASSGATSYDVYFGASPSPPLAANTPLTSYTPPTPAPGLYYWRVVAKNASGSANSPTWSFTVMSGFCSYALSASSVALGAAGGSSSVNVTAATGCAWTAVSNANWITITAGSSGSGNGTVSFSASALPSAAPRSGTLTIAGKTFTVNESAQTSALLVPITPCRVADTRKAIGPFGGPALPAQSSRVFIIPNSACNIPANASAYSLNIAVVPSGLLGYLTAYPTGQPVPLVATLNSIDGRVKSNAAIVPAGTGGAISIFVTDATDVIIDINGYFVSNNNPAALAFYPLTPCRVADTRNPNGPLGGPGFAGQDVRTFPVLSSNCNIPAAARAYALNFAAVPNGPLGYMTAWPTGQPQPVVSSLNAPTGAVTANAVIVGAGTNGGVDVFAFSATDLVIDITGYFAPPGAGGLSLYNVAPCRVLDTRLPAGSPPFTGARDVNVAGSPCNVPVSAQAYVFSATVVPPGPLGYLTMWPQGQPQPPTATLNAGDGAVTSNLAIIPTNNGSVSAFALSSTHLVLDIFGYFGP
jgi:PA domain-containing protein/BACON domain-containing protein